MTPRAFVLLTAMPPTKGHLALIKYAHQLTTHVTVIVNTQPGEPYPHERFDALYAATRGMFGVKMVHIHETMPQEPEDYPGFWTMWRGILWDDYGMRAGDYIVASEQYGVELANRTHGVFMPYDLDRSIVQSRATDVREHPLSYFHEILPEFQPVLRKTVTIFGAESVGKTTLADSLADRGLGVFLFEWARPYLESVGPEITTEKMTNIWKGQLALQKHGQSLEGYPFIVQDTDLFSTVGYWDLWNMGTPGGLVNDAVANKSDLYIIPRSNIPFEADPLRYGGDKRESGDGYWISICQNFGLNYVVLDGSAREERLQEAREIIWDMFSESAHIGYDRVAQKRV